MNCSFHPAAAAEFLESVGYYESMVPGLGAALIEEFETLAELIGESPKKAGRSNWNQIFAEFPCKDFRYPSFTGKIRAGFRFWLLPTTGGGRSTGLAGCDNRLYSDRSKVCDGILPPVISGRQRYKKLF